MKTKKVVYVNGMHTFAVLVWIHIKNTQQTFNFLYCTQKCCVAYHVQIIFLLWLTEINCEHVIVSISNRMFKKKLANASKFGLTDLKYHLKELLILSRSVWFGMFSGIYMQVENSFRMWNIELEEHIGFNLGSSKDNC